MTTYRPILDAFTLLIRHIARYAPHLSGKIASKSIL